jgi:hypothetical protein
LAFAAACAGSAAVAWISLPSLPNESSHCRAFGEDPLGSDLKAPSIRYHDSSSAPERNRSVVLNGDRRADGNVRIIDDEIGKLTGWRSLRGQRRGEVPAISVNDHHRGVASRTPTQDRVAGFFEESRASWWGCARCSALSIDAIERRRITSTDPRQKDSKRLPHFDVLARAQVDGHAGGASPSRQTKHAIAPRANDLRVRI